jgi:hypothetical protein
MRLSELHLKDYARVDSSMAQTFTAEQGWTIEVRPELGGVIISRKTDGAPNRAAAVWLPFANCRNGVPVEVPQKSSK